MPAFATTADTSSLSSSIQDLISRPPVHRAKKHSKASAPSSTITVPIPLSSLLTPEEITRLDQYKDSCEEKFWITKLLGRKKRKGDKGGAQRVKDVTMSRKEYEAYWARDEDGNIVATDPEWVGRERLRERLWGELGLFGESKRRGKGEGDRYI